MSFANCEKCGKRNRIYAKGLCNSCYHTSKGYQKRYEQKKRDAKKLEIKVLTERKSNG